MTFASLCSRVFPAFETTIAIPRIICIVYADALTACYWDGRRGAPLYGKYLAYEILNPAENYTYDLMRSIYKEIRATFKDEYIHLGMDEVYHECWYRTTRSPISFQSLQ